MEANNQQVVHLEDDGSLMLCIFPIEVLPILVKQLSMLDASELHHQWHYKNVCLKLRLVCRDWKQEVDCFLEGFAQQFVFKEILLDNHPAQKLKCPWNWFPRLHVMKDLPVVQECFERTQHQSAANTFVTGTFSVRFRDIWLYGPEETQEERERRQKLCLEFFRKYGTQVRYIRIFLPSYDVEWHVWIYKLLEHLPYVKGMSILFQFAKPSQPVIRHQMLEFKNLQVLKLRNAYSLQTSLIQTNPQLAELEVYIDKAFNIFHCQLESLTHLKIKNDPKRCVPAQILQLQLQTLKASPFDWRITELELECGDQEISFVLLSDALEVKLKKTLKHLRLRFGTIHHIDRSARLSLPNLETLNIHVVKYETIDFILPMTDNLQQLFVRTEEEHKVFFDARNLIRFYRSRNKLYESNIWEMFKNLKKIGYETDAIQKLESNVCTRQDRKTYKDFLVASKYAGCIVC